MLGYFVACLLGLTISGLFITNRPLHATGFYVFSRTAAQAIFTPSTQYAIPATGVLGVAFLFSSIFYLVAARKNIALPFRSSLNPLLVLLVASAISTLFSENIALSIASFLRIATWITIYYILTTTVKDKKDCKSILLHVIASSTVAVFYGFYQHLSGGYTYKYGGTYITSFFSTPNAYGIFLSLSLFSAIMLFSICENKKERKYVLISIFLFIFSLVYTMHRASWLLMFLFFILLSLRYLNKKKMYLFLSIGVLFLFIFNDVLVERLFEYKSRQYGIGSINSRLITWETIFEEIKKDPVRCITTGFGVGIATPQRVSTGIVPHNDYLRILFEIGLVGVIAYISFLLSLLWRSMKNSCKSKHLLLTISPYAIVYFSVVSFTQNNFYDVRNMSIFMVITSVSYCTRRHDIR